MRPSDTKALAEQVLPPVPWRSAEGAALSARKIIPSDGKFSSEKANLGSLSEAVDCAEGKGC
jgi:hypothetical protein